MGCLVAEKIPSFFPLHLGDGLENHELQVPEPPRSSVQRRQCRLRHKHRAHLSHRKPNLRHRSSEAPNPNPTGPIVLEHLANRRLAGRRFSPRRGRKPPLPLHKPPPPSGAPPDHLQARRQRRQVQPRRRFHRRRLWEVGPNLAVTWFQEGVFPL